MVSLQVIALRYRRTARAMNDERCIDAFQDSGVYETLGLPVEIWEPDFPEALRQAEETENLGRLGGLVAGKTAEAVRTGSPVLMTGGDCTHITGIVGGLQSALGAGARIGLAWLDAHGDINTPHTTLTGSLGGMPVAVCAGLAFPEWRTASGIQAPLPTDRILMVDVRNLDPAEKVLIEATEIAVAAPAPGFPGQDLGAAVGKFAAGVDAIYLHIDSDILDRRFVPNHGTGEPHGPDLEQVGAAIEAIMATGKVSALAVVSVYGGEPGRAASLASGIGLIDAGLSAWKTYGWPQEA